MPRAIVQHSTNDRGLLLEEGTVTRLRVTEATGSLLDTANVADGLVALVGQFGNGKIQGRVNGSATVPVSVNATDTSPGPPANLTFGASGVTDNFLRGSVRHVIVTQGLTAHEIMQLEAWLLWEIGQQGLLSGDHPYRNVRP